MDIKTYLNDKKKIVENGLKELMLPEEGPFLNHFEAMRYSLFAGGKRVRPILCLAAAEAVNHSADTQKNLLPVACALECIHTYSLVHDDLPAMDDDDLRRGQDTNHTLYGEAAAILAGDGLLTWGFDILSDTTNSPLSAEKRLAIIQVISRAAGPYGMVGGQALDIGSENSDFPFSTLQTIHKSKTGALITGSVHAGGLGADASKEQIEQLKIYGDKIGLAFQIVDDLLNATSTTEQLGKAAGSDASRGKATYPAYFGVEGTRQKALEAVDGAIGALQDFDDQADPLRALARYIYTRSN
ncbi:MAG: polyprenyl synthetase family protein [Desulfobulbaceae bacterium]|nr:polyprenyl synthetase family protein [Desulfobulbaceae bacterium]